MEQIMTKELATLTPDPIMAIRPAIPEALDEPPPLDQRLIEGSLEDGADRRGDRATRHDGWTPERIRAFLVTLADCGCVTVAAKAAGMSLRSAYALRNRAEGRTFHYAWEAALQIARRSLADALMSRAVHGHTDQIRRNGVVVAERFRFDNRLGMATLTRLDQRAAANDLEAEAVRTAVEEFDQFVSIASNGGAGAVDFIATRRKAGTRAEQVLERLENYTRYQVGLPNEIDTSDLDPAQRDNWTAEQEDRALRSGLVAELEKKAELARWRRGERTYYNGDLEYFDPDGRFHWISPAEAIRRGLPDCHKPAEVNGNDESREL